MITRYLLVATRPYSEPVTGAVRPVGYIANAILWDGVSSWMLPSGFQAVQDTQGAYQIGNSYP